MTRTAANDSGMAMIITLTILLGLAVLLWRAVASFPLFRLLACSFGQWAEVCRNEPPLH